MMTNMKLEIYEVNPQFAHDSLNMISLETNHPAATAFIVRAVNNHDALVEAVRTAIRPMQRLPPTPAGDYALKLLHRALLAVDRVN